jgi:hypothetical protein
MAGSQEFINMMLPYAMEASKISGIDPRIIVAQSALETGYGRSAPGNNYFGIKSHGKSGGNNLATTEVINGQPVKINDSFRAYSGPRESALGYADFINSNPRYSGMKTAQGLEAQISALGSSGYATDPNYAQKVASIAARVPFSGTMPQASPYAGMADGPKGQEAYPGPVMGSMMAGSPQPQAMPQQQASAPIPAAAQALANPRASANNIFGMMAAQPQQQAQFSPVQIAGPSPEQANALSSLIAALTNRMA